MPRSPWSILGLLTACAAHEAEPVPLWAALTRDGVVVFRGDDPGPPLVGSAGAETFCWDHRARGFFLTRGGEISWLPLEGGERRTLTGGFQSVRFPAVSSQGLVAFAATQVDNASEGWGVWTVSSDGGEPRRIASGYDPSWSPDGTRLYYEDFTPDTTLYVCDLQTMDVRPVPIGEGRGHTVECSPSGRYLAFSGAGGLSLYTLADASTRNLTDGSSYDRFASFSPDERILSFHRQRSREGEETRFFIVHYDLATGVETPVPMGPDALPAWAPGEPDSRDFFPDPPPM